MADVRVKAMKVSWNIGYSNLPGLDMLLENEMPYPKEGWRLFPVEGGNFLVHRDKPVVRYIFESQHGGGALGGLRILEDGTEYKSNGGWSSNPGALNGHRAEFGGYLPHDVCGVTYYGEYARKGTYNDGWGLGIAGCAFDVPWLQAWMAIKLPGVELLPTGDTDENQASADQALIVGGLGGYGYVPAAIDREETTIPGIKAKPGTELFDRTAMDADRRWAQRLKERAGS